MLVIQLSTSVIAINLIVYEIIIGKSIDCKCNDVDRSIVDTVIVWILVGRI